MFKYKGYESDERRMKMSLKGINNDESKLMVLKKFCRIVIISRAVACYRWATVTRPTFARTVKIRLNTP